jgi:hypothetical protein
LAGRSTQVFQKKNSFFGLPWNVIDSKGPKMRKMGQLRLPWNVYENKRLSLDYPGMLLMKKDLGQKSATFSTGNRQSEISNLLVRSSE